MLYRIDMTASSILRRQFIYEAYPTNFELVVSWTRYPAMTICSRAEPGALTAGITLMLFGCSNFESVPLFIGRSTQNTELARMALVVAVCP